MHIESVIRSLQLPVLYRVATLMRASVIAVPSSIGRRMFVRLPWAETDNVGVVEFMFFL